MILLGRALPYIIVAALVALALTFAYKRGYNAGSDAVKVEWAEQAAAQAKAAVDEMAKRQAEFETKLAAARAIGEQTAEVTERIRVVTKTVVERVPVYVPSDSPPLPAGWGVLHDAAARGDPLPDDPAAATRAYGPGPSAADAAEVVARNYGTYHEIAERLNGLQRYVQSVCLAPRDP